MLWIRDILALLRIRILLFSSLPDKMPTKKNVFFLQVFLLITLHQFSKAKTFFACWWKDPDPVLYKIIMDLDPGAQKHANSTDPDPQHWWYHWEKRRMTRSTDPQTRIKYLCQRNRGARNYPVPHLVKKLLDAFIFFLAKRILYRLIFAADVPELKSKVRRPNLFIYVN